MNSPLKISWGQYSDRGKNHLNQDFHGILVPNDSRLTTKGIAVALADGVSTSDVSHEASEAAVTSFFEDYYSTSEAWSVKNSAQCVLNAVNSWLYSQTQRSHYRYNFNKGYVCTFSGIIIKSATAHIFHVGDSRIYQLHGNTLEKLTNEHRVQLSEAKHYLQRALGMDPYLIFDYLQVNLEVGSTFILMTDGIYEYVPDESIASIFNKNDNDLELAARKMAELAIENGSDDDLTVQIIRIEGLPELTAIKAFQALSQLPFAPALTTNSKLDGYTILRQLYQSARSHIYLANDEDAQQEVVIKVPSNGMQSNEKQLERFLIEEWIAKQINSIHVINAHHSTRKKKYLYATYEYIGGKTLAQWMIDNPLPSLEQVRDIIEQISNGLLAFHRLEMLHQDLCPENIMVELNGTVKIIDFGSTWVAGLEEVSSTISRKDTSDTSQYSAPEYFIGEYGTSLSDQFSLAVIAYQMLSGRLPYGAKVAKARTHAAQRKLKYRSVVDENREIPAWVDFTLRKALHPEPSKRYEVISEFLYDLRHPNKAFADQRRLPLAERNPILFWRCVSFILIIITIAIIYFH